MKTKELTSIYKGGRTAEFVKAEIKDRFGEKEANKAVEEVVEKHLNKFPYGGVIGNPSIMDFLFGRNK